MQIVHVRLPLRLPSSFGLLPVCHNRRENFPPRVESRGQRRSRPVLIHVCRVGLANNTIYPGRHSGAGPSTMQSDKTLEEATFAHASLYALLAVRNESVQVGLSTHSPMVHSRVS